MKTAKRQTWSAGSAGAVPQQWPPEPRPGEDPFYILVPSPVADENNRVLYTEQVPEIAQEPDYDKALAKV
jgi:hypothetical protein